jgi:hypothetical protein
VWVFQVAGRARTSARQAAASSPTAGVRIISVNGNTADVSISSRTRTHELVPAAGGHHAAGSLQGCVAHSRQSITHCKIQRRSGTATILVTGGHIKHETTARQEDLFEDSHQRHPNHQDYLMQLPCS